MGSSLQPARGPDGLYHDNLRLNRVEYQLERTFLYSRPTCLGLVLGTDCNLRCLHCYQTHDGDRLIPPGAIGRELRRELSGLYPYLSTLRLSGGEVFAIHGFDELLEDVARSAARPIVGVSTNGTLIDERWAERIVRTPFRNITFSLDAGTAGTYARLRRGAKLDGALGGLSRVQEWKARLGSASPRVDSFFVILRSNFREIPAYLDLLARHGVTDASFQLLEVTAANRDRVEDEVFSDRAEVEELHALLCAVMAARGSRVIRLCGVRTLFERHGLDAAFTEAAEGLHPETGGAGEARLDACPNPWTTLFIDETGSAYLCFLAEPVGSIYEAPLQRIWNGAEAVARRTEILAGRYAAARCGADYCSWREGHRATPPEQETERDLLREMAYLRGRLRENFPDGDSPVPESPLDRERRLVTYHRRCAAELRGLLDPMEELLAAGEAHIRHLESKAARAVSDFEAVRAEYDAFRRPLLVRAAAWLAGRRRALGRSGAGPGKRSAN